ncbi:1-acylglycerol-3-phosphate O-acyltransferase Pnpla3 isoform X2 [Condylostylus longicornis]|uniref:1-acylglycerol-3-phosphate O-acyltransferase Pnpla3 isoform X2 n=1 Tax=Condylostylus longicornis TaxID=2530218 RepID=UPI00244E3B62|nr:1-acylglycerol-3-phosphate O-acyltransferase Pnpla3 isoform X2 [Condylostylus longicornis]
MNLSFAGCGFLGIYHVGVAVCFKKYAPHLLLEKIGGASAGALAACCLLCDLPLGEMTSDFFRVVNEARKHSLGPFSPSFNIQTCLFEGLQKHLPDDAHKRVSGRLHISLTRVYDGKNVIVSQFNSREDLLQALLCACFIPGFSGILPPRFHGVRYMDGAFSDNLPILDENTITVSPFCGESDICPRDQSSQLFHLNWANTSIEISTQNIHRFVRILFPPRPEYLSKFCQQGFDDALQFLHRNNLISCRRCVAVQSTFVVSEGINDTQDFDPECRECKKHRKDALRANMPETVLDVIQSYIDQANKGLVNWLFKNRGVKIISLPATLPVEIFLLTISKLSSAAPKISNQLRYLIELILSQFGDVLNTKLINKIKMGLIDMPEFDTMGGLYHRNRCDSIVYDEFGILNNDNDTYDELLKVSTHQDAVYAYYYTNDHNKVTVNEIFDLTEGNIPADLTIIDDVVNDTVNVNMQAHQNYLIECDWNGAEADGVFITNPNDHYYNHHFIYEHHNNNNNNTNNINNNNNTMEDIIMDNDSLKNYSRSPVELFSGSNSDTEFGSDYSESEADHHVKENTRNGMFMQIPETTNYNYQQSQNIKTNN